MKKWGLVLIVFYFAVFQRPNYHVFPHVDGFILRIGAFASEKECNDARLFKRDSELPVSDGSIDVSMVPFGASMSTERTKCWEEKENK